MAASPRRSASVAPGMAIHIPPSFGNPGVSISYRPKALVEGKTCFSSPLLSVAVPPASIHHIFNHRQWRAGMLMSDALVSGAFDVTNRNVLELGSGTGLPSITAAQLDKAKLVVSSDYDEPAIVAELKSNIKSNSAGKRIKVAGHIWGKNIQELLDCLPTSRGQQQPKFDLILMADCLWDPLSHSDLLKTLTLTLAKTPEARVHVIAGLHTGREKITGFVRRAYRAGLTLAPIANASCWPSLPVDKTTSEGHINVSDEPLRHASERILELQNETPAMAMASMLIVAGAGARRFKNPSRILRTIKTLPRASRAMSTRTSPAPAPRLFKTASPPVSRIGLSLAHRRFSIELPASKPAPLAEYEGPLARTFTRLKLFSLGSLALASTLTPVLLLAPGEISMAGRVGLAITALATSGVSTALIAWIGQPYAGRMRLLESSSQPKLEIDTVSWKLQPRITTIHEPSFIRATSRPFATWELTNTPPLISNETAITKIVAETMDVKTGKSVGQWIVKYDPSAKTKVNGEWKVAGKCEMVGQPQRYFNVHEELLDDSWRVLG